MGKATVFLAALALALALALAALADASPGAGGAMRRSRFLQAVVSPAPVSSYYDCVKKPPSVCMEAGSPGKTCCKGVCTNTESSAMTCGNCNRACKLGKTCCGGKCVDLFDDKKNCGKCFNECSKKCKSGLCDYAG